MARKPQVTRTITTTRAKVTCLDVATESLCEKEVTLPRTYKNDEAILKAAREMLDTEETKAVHVKSSEVTSTLYGMSEQCFIEHAHVLPPRGILEIDETDAEDEANA